MGKRRLTYQDGNGKRHWVPRVLLRLPDGVEFREAENQYGCRTAEGNQSNLATPEIIDGTDFWVIVSGARAM